MSNKKLILSLVALNAVSTPLSAQIPKYEKLYNKIVKNLDTEKSNNESYKLIENILKTRNKELKDLYLQNEYVIKPEFLEWQVYFTGFYNNKDRGGTKENGLLSHTRGEAKSVDLGMVIPVKGIYRDEINLNISQIKEPAVNVNIGSVAAPVLTAPDFSFETTDVPVIPIMYTPYFDVQNSLQTMPIGNITAVVSYNTSGNSVYDNLNVESINGTTFSFNGNNDTLDISGEASYMNGSYIGVTAPSNFHSSYSNGFSAINISNNGQFNVDGNWEYIMSDSQGYPTAYVGFLSYRPYYINVDSRVTFSGNLNLEQNNSTSGFSGTALVGLSLNLNNLNAAPTAKAVLENTGVITMKNGTENAQRGVAMQLEAAPSAYTVYGELINSGTINIESNVGNVGGSVGKVGVFVELSSSDTGRALVKPGKINVLGIGNKALEIGGYYSSSSSVIASNIVVDGDGGKLYIGGQKNVGIYVTRYNAPLGSTNGLENIKNLNIELDGRDGMGFIRGTQRDPDKAGSMTINDSVIKKISFGDNSISSIFFRADYGNLILDSSLSNSMGIINSGAQSVVGYVSYNGNIINNSSINVSSGSKAMTVFYLTGGKLENHGDIVNDSPTYDYIEQWGGMTQYGATTIIAKGNNALVENTGNIDMTSESGTALNNEGTVNSSNDHIIMTGDKSTLVYGSFTQVYNPSTGNNDFIPSNTNLGSNKLEINGNNGAVLYSAGGNISLSPLVSGGTLELTANGKNTYAFYNVKGGYGNNTVQGKFFINGNVNANIKNGGIGLNYNGNGIFDTITGLPLEAVNISDELTKVVDVSNGTLNIISDSDSYNLIMTNIPIKVSGLQNLGTSNINFSGEGVTKLFKGALYLDIDSNLDRNNNIGDKSYRNLEIGQSNITVNSGITVSGSEESLVGLVQSAKNSERHSTLINNGTISLIGNNSKGIYLKRGNISNTGLVEVTGKNGIGIFSTGADIENTGIIKVGDNGVGIYGDTYIEITDNPWNINSNIVNKGEIIAEDGEKAIGIYANENALYYVNSVMNLLLDSNSNIDMRKSEKSVGIYLNKGSLNSTSSSGTISVGKDSYGIYLKDSNADLNNLTLNLSGDNAVGVYTDGTSTFNGTGTVNIDGKGIVIFNIDSSGSFNQNFNINSTAGSTYVLQNINNTTLYSNGISHIGEGGIFINGANSAVLLGLDSEISSFNSTTGDFDSNIIGMALSGGNSSGLPVSINGEMIMREATNRGLMTFGNNSSGIYVSDGASALNEGTITLGTDSVGIYGRGVNSGIDNTGFIKIKDNSVGMLLNNGTISMNRGTIEGNGERIIGMYSDSLNDSLIFNMNKIALSGDKAIGVYLSGEGSQILYNYETISVGDSSSALDPSIGVYNKSSTNTVYNLGIISLGEKSIGIYNKGGEVIQNTGTINISKDGVGIYSESGNINLDSGTINVMGENGIGVYGINGMTLKNNSIFNITDNSYGMVLSSNSGIENSGTAKLGENSVFVYSDGASEIINNLGADIEMTGSDSVAFYMTNGGSIKNSADIEGNNGHSNIGIYNKDGSIENTGNIKIGDSLILNPEDPFANSYSVGVYGENAINVKNSGNMEIGADAVGFYTKGNINEALNTGNITSTKEGAIGLYLENGMIRNEGNISLSGDKSIGIAAARNVTLTNAGIITMNGNDSIGIYANTNSAIINESTGIININGNNSTGIQLSGGSTLENYGIISLAAGLTGSKDIVTGESVYTPPSIINAGVIKVDEKFEIDGVNLTIKVDPSTLKVPTLSDIEIGGYAPEDIDAGFLLSNSVTIKAPSFDLGGNAVKIDPLFTQGTNARVYKFENVFDPTTPEGGPNTGEVGVKSGSLTFDAIPVANKTTGAIDIWMEKINYSEFTKGSWQNEFAEKIEGKYLNATGEALKLYDRLDLITEEEDLRSNFNQLAGSMYANIKQREQDIAGVFNNALYVLQNSENNTKENVKINVISGKGKTKEDTRGIESYDYDSIGVLALREVERTYKHKLAYSLGYTRTNFKIDGSNNEDKADTVQLGLHNKYSVNGWNLKSDILGRVSFHDTERKINWSDGTNSELNSDYNVYGLSLMNEVGKDIEIGKNVKLIPYAGFEIGYMMHPGIEEKGGSESLKIERNEAYSVRPNIGLRLEGEKRLGNRSDWKIKGDAGIGYEYELGNMNKEEKANLSLIEEGYHKLAKASDDKGRIKTNANVGVELNDRHGVYITGEYGRGNDGREDYKIGISLKTSF